LLDLLAALASDLGVRQPIRLVQSEQRVLPMTWGVWRPVVLLPGGAECWTEEHLKMALVHELAHVRRRDFAIRILARLSCAWHWFNPLAWLAARRLREEQERACDDIVLDRGVDPVEYASGLLALAAFGVPRGPGFLAAAGMATGSPVERRLRSILDPTQDRRPLARRQVALAALAMVCLLAPLATAKIGMAGAVADPQRADAPSAKRENSSNEPADVLEQLRQLYVTPPDEARLRAGAIKGMVEALHDPYSTYLDRDETARMDGQVRGTLVGIGARLKTSEGHVVVEFPLPDGPAQKAGIRPGDLILEANGISLEGLDAAQAARLLTGEAGTRVRLRVKCRDGQVALFEFARGPFTLRTVRDILHHEGNGQQWMLDPQHKVGYAHVEQFGSATPAELRAAVQALLADGMKGLILDLRSCPGGLLEAAVAVANVFLAEGTIVTIRGRGGAETVMKADAATSLGTFPVMVLINDQTASAAEVVAGALQDRGRAVLVGSRTRGKGSVQSLVRLKDGAGAIRLTTAHYNLPGGRNIDRAEGKPTWGIDPDDRMFVPQDAAEFAAILLRRRIRTAQEAAAPAAQQEPPDAIATAIDPEDAPLSAALRALVGKLTTGEYTPVGPSRVTQAEYARRREEMRMRRAALLNDIEKVDKELDDLRKAEAGQTPPGGKG
jgi:carboxyl-terminal processing protease